MARHSPELSVLGNSTRITGRVSGDGGLRVEGTVKGDVSITGALDLAEGASIDGNVEAESVEVTGSLLGDVSASGSVLVRSSAVVRGDLRAAQVSVEPGARIAIRLDADFELDLGQSPRRK
jgi:cytoskeletal protein CcmA (bactofilin family)